MNWESRRIGPYELRDTIGQGGMAAVYRAYQPSLDRVVAIKVMSSNLASDPEFMERFRQEARAVARLTHPNIVVVHDFGEEAGLPYLVMEYVEGPTLADLLVEGFSRERIPEVLTQVAAGLDYAHAHGIVHRDVKPQNVLVTPEGRAVLADFGLARMVESAQRLTLAGGIVGTPEYMSPEQAAGRPTDHRTDIYALGVILYEMVVGARPFSAETPLGVLMKHINDLPEVPPALLAELPPLVDTVIQIALAKDPDERFQSAGELARAYLEAVGSPMASRSRAPGTRSGVRKPPPSSQPPELDLSKYGGLQRDAARAARPHRTPSMATRSFTRPAQPPLDPAPPAPLARRPGPRSQKVAVRTCPSCKATIPAGAGMCPECMYILPFEEPSEPVRREPERKDVRINLLPYNLRWDPNGLDQARVIAQAAANQLASEGWELVRPLETSGTFLQGRTAAGPVVQSAVLSFQRIT